MDNIFVVENSNKFKFDDIEIKKVYILNAFYNELHIEIDVKKCNHQEFEKFHNYIKETYKSKKIKHILKYMLNFNDDIKLKDKIEFIIKKICLEYHNIYICLEDSQISLVGNEITIHLKNDIFLEQIKNLKIDNFIKRNIIECLQLYDISIVYTNEQITQTTEVIEQTQDVKVMIVDPQIGKEIKSTVEVFDIEEKEIVKKTGGKSKLISFYVTDYENSLMCKKFYNSDEKVNIKIGDIVEIKGTYLKEEIYSKEYYVKLKSINKIGVANHNIVDDAQEKRVELSVKTNMSEMYSNIDCKKLPQVLHDIGYKAFAVTDLGVVHSYPFLKNKLGIKTIFGIDAYIVDDYSRLVNNPKDINLDEETYVVFDLETTGFDPYKDKIIEIGAVKIKGNEKIDEFSCFVDPEMPIPHEISKITNITDDMVKGSDTIDTVLPKFLEFVKDTTLVAHNANFDVGFISEKSNQMNLKVQFSYIDTIIWAKFCMPNLKRFNLDALAKAMDIENENHHRAVNDAMVTAKIFKNLLTKISTYNVNTLKEINQKLQLDTKIAPVDKTTILVKNQEGLRNIYELVSNSLLVNFGNGKPRIKKSELEKYKHNFFISSSPNMGLNESGELIRMYVRGIDKTEIEEHAKFYDYIQLLPRDCYERQVGEKEIPNYEYIIEMNKFFYNLGKKLEKRVVAVCNPMYYTKDESIAKSVLQISTGDIKGAKYNTGAYFRNTQQMLEEFSYLGNKECYEVVVENTNEIANEIENLSAIPEGFYPPIIEGSDKIVEKLAMDKAHELYGENIPKVIDDRIKRELDSIIGNGFAVLYLIAQKLVKKSVDSGYIVGSRGSVGSSIVAYLIGITEVNGLSPHYRCNNCKNIEIFEMELSGVDLEIKNCPNCNIEYIRDGHRIPFEVFMGFNGDKVPDIDLNFSGEYQDKIHRYTEQLFGKENVFRAGTISKTQENNAIGYVKKYYEIKLKDKIEYELQRAKDQGLVINEEEFKNNLKENEMLKASAEIRRLAKLIVGTRKTTGQHPGGMVVIPNNMSVYDFTPVQKPANDLTSDSTTTHFDYHVMDEQLVKLDILGHDDPTTLKMLEDLTGLSPYDIPLTDKKVLSLFTSTASLGVTAEQILTDLGVNGIPEFGTSFVKEMLKDTKPTTFTELVRISGLSHGTDVWLNNAKDYVNNGVATLKEIISVRDDIMNYLILQGMEKGLAFKIMEFVRKGRPTKDKEGWQNYKEEMKKAGIKDWYIESCEKIKYMFPKGHAVAYVMMAMRIAYYKVYYPLEFYTAFLNRKVSDFNIGKMFIPIDQLKKSYLELNQKSNKNVNDKSDIALMEILIEMHYRNIRLLPVDLYKSESNKFLIEDGMIRMPFIGLDQLGETVAKNIVLKRNIEKFTSKQDLSTRCGVNQSVMATLEKYGVLNGMTETDQGTLF